MRYITGLDSGGNPVYATFQPGDKYYQKTVREIFVIEYVEAMKGNTNEIRIGGHSLGAQLSLVASGDIYTIFIILVIQLCLYRGE